MKREPISHYLRNPSKLVDISVSQIKKWLEESPYSQPLRVLLAKKMHYNQDIIMDTAISGAASISSNRTWLYRELQGKVDYQTHNSDEALAPMPLNQNDDIADTVDNAAKLTSATTEEVQEDTLDSNAKEAELTSDKDANQPTQTPDNQPKEVPDKSKGTESETIKKVIEVEFEEVVNVPKEKKERVAKEIKIEKSESDDNPKNESDDEVLENTVATLDRDTHEPKLIQLNAPNEEIHLTHEAIDNMKVEIVGPDEEFAPPHKILEAQIAESKKKEKEEKKKKSKKDSNKKKKSKKEKTKTDKPSKEKNDKKKKSDKKSEGDKKDEKLDKKKKKTSDKKKKDKSAKKSAKKKARKKKMADYWESKVGTITPPPDVMEQMKKDKKKGKKIKLSKYNVSISPSEEEANRYYGGSEEMSDYTRWLLEFTKGDEDSSFKHMSTYVSQSRRLDTVSSEANKVKKKKAKKGSKKIKSKNKSKAKAKSKADKSLDSNEEIISELWADLLAKQGHMKKARKMYLKLSLKYPEKSSYFAAKLENLKKNK